MESVRIEKFEIFSVKMSAPAFFLVFSPSGDGKLTDTYILNYRKYILLLQKKVTHESNNTGLILYPVIG
jgi:hypothetical protein